MLRVRVCERCEQTRYRNMYLRCCSQLCASIRTKYITVLLYKQPFCLVSKRRHEKRTISSFYTQTDLDCTFRVFFWCCSSQWWCKSRWGERRWGHRNADSPRALENRKYKNEIQRQRERTKKTKTYRQHSTQASNSNLFEMSKISRPNDETHIYKWRRASRYRY